MNIFIDTNVFLSFYHFTSDDLEEFIKLSVLIEKGEVVLYLPEQVQHEYWRNREVKIAEALKGLKKQNLSLEFPTLCKDYEEYSMLRDLQKDFEKEHASLVSKIDTDINKNTLKADKVIEELFAKAEQIETSDKLLDLANMRVGIGNPPGKNGSLGDAINWEALLSTVPDKEELYFIADDKDYFSALDKDKPKEFLIREWKKKKKSEITFYRQISFFFKEYYPHIKLASELEKELAVQMLVSSGNFEATHLAVAKLNNYQDFSESQANEIVDAALTNEQVNWIISDSDVFMFLCWLVGKYSEKINTDAMERLNKVLLGHDSEHEDDFPFG